MNHPDPTDYYGIILHVGDRIVYPVGLGSSGVGISEAIIDKIEPLIPIEPHEPTVRYGWKLSDMHKPEAARTEIELPTTYDPECPNPLGGVGAYRWTDGKLYKLRVKPISQRENDGYSSSVWREVNGRRWYCAERSTWIKNVQNVVRAPEAVQV